jgi:hypothetical protein
VLELEALVELEELAELEELELLLELAVSAPQPESSVVDAINAIHRVRKRVLFISICRVHSLCLSRPNRRYRGRYLCSGVSCILSDHCFELVYFLTKYEVICEVSHRQILAALGC